MWPLVSSPDAAIRIRPIGAYGVVFDFIIVAFAIFMIVKAINKLRRQQAEAPAEPAAP